jgi:hypothetical protein
VCSEERVQRRRQFEELLADFRVSGKDLTGRKGCNCTENQNCGSKSEAKRPYKLNKLSR